MKEQKKKKEEIAKKKQKKKSRKLANQLVRPFNNIHLIVYQKVISKSNFEQNIL